MLDFSRLGNPLFLMASSGFRRVSVKEEKQAARVIRFESFEVNLRSGELWKNGEKVKLPEQSFQILAMLLERPGEVVLRRDPFGSASGLAQHSHDYVLYDYRSKVLGMTEDPDYTEVGP